MPMQPAPSGAAPAPSPAQPGQSPQQPPQQGGGASQLVADIHDKLMKLMDMVQGAKLPPEDVQELGQVISGFEAFVNELTQGPDKKEEQSEAPSPSGPQAPEAGGNPNAQPA